MKVRLLSLVLCAFGAIGCHDPFGPDGVRDERRISHIEWPGFSPTVTAPDTVSAGTKFDVSVITFASGCYRQGDTEASVTGSTASITPYDFFPVEIKKGYACEQPLYRWSHTARVSFDRAGPAVIRVIGRRYPGDAPITVERTVVVR